jgi:hypothetical protein
MIVFGLITVQIPREKLEVRGGVPVGYVDEQ